MPHRHGQGSVLLVILVVLAVVLGTATGLVPPPPNPFAESDPTILNRTGDGDLIRELRTTEESKAEPKMQVRLAPRNETISLILHDGNGTRLDVVPTVTPGTRSVELTFLPPSMTEIQWTPTNPYVLRASGQQSGQHTVLYIRIPYGAK